eukprot:CAMPEP_0176424538 /NCGR_PEP_ID=MMETSP0127-20121128/10889_1 /TAXON_ID=938130 /ORGANISM="Platyophrya macrostoma, Strain WH" /LENGTH=223 /DNA_ID=CAMNT_0017805599 /DNA_START=29 /DNA_END=700 /DNA_ORIENTATION=+
MTHGVLVTESNTPSPKAAVKAHSARLTVVPERQCNAQPQVYFSVIRVPKSFRSVEVETVFSALRQDWAKPLELFAILTIQPVDVWGATCVDCTQSTDEASAFKDTSGESFLAFVDVFKRSLCPHLSEDDMVGVERLASDIWLNASDPATGLPLLTEFGERSFTTYDEGSGMEMLAAFGKSLINTPLGPCHVCTHPRFGTNFYPATLFVACRDAAVVLQACEAL